ncbi:MAG: 4-hydroxy-tetrahydrodipicolinate reductase [Vicingaceae bacterium]
MRIAISGYGKMGKAVEEIALERGHSISLKFDSGNKNDWQELNESNTDVIIDFSTPDSVLRNISQSLDMKLPIVVGTTGWYDELENIKKKVTEKNGALLWASNFSIGVNIFFELNRQLAGLMSNQDQYNAAIKEIHHVHKLDSPSGTAISLANDLINLHSTYSHWRLGENNLPNVLPIRADRIDEVPGTHSVTYASEIDEIKIEHVAKSRKGFASGAVIAAEWLYKKSGFFNMSDVLKR